jgi:hypothetical protein
VGYGRAISWSPAHRTPRPYPLVAAAAALLVLAPLPLCVAALAAPTAVAAPVPPGGAWTAGAPFPNEGANETPAMLSCGSPGFCVALDQQMAGAWTYSDGKWAFDAHAGPSGGFGTLTGLQCFAARTCVATDAEADLVTYAGGKWERRPGPTQNGGGPMGCPSAGLCLFVDGVGQSYTWDGRQFSRPTVAYPTLANTMGSGAAYIACAAATRFCAVVDELGSLGTYDGGHWGPLAAPFKSAPLGAGCLSATACIAAFRPPPGHPAPEGDWAEYDGRGWSRTPGGTHGFPAATTGTAQSLSCGTGFCADLGQVGPGEGRAVVWHGGPWAATGLFPDGGVQPEFLSCAPTNWCMALYAPGQGRSPGRTWLLEVR